MASGVGVRQSPAGERARHHLVPECGGDPLGLPRPRTVGIVGPGLFEHEDVGLERRADGDGIKGPRPPVHPGMHVEVGNGQHGPGRR